jgi:hypothetical protein
MPTYAKLNARNMARKELSRCSLIAHRNEEGLNHSSAVNGDCSAVAPTGPFAMLRMSASPGTRRLAVSVRLFPSPPPNITQPGALIGGHLRRLYSSAEMRALTSDSAPFGPACRVDDRRVLIAWPMIRAFRRADVAFPNRKTADGTSRRRRSFRLSVSYRSVRQTMPLGRKADSTAHCRVLVGKRAHACGFRSLVSFALDLAHAAVASERGALPQTGPAHAAPRGTVGRVLVGAGCVRQLHNPPVTYSDGKQRADSRVDFR